MSSISMQNITWLAKVIGEGILSILVGCGAYALKYSATKANEGATIKVLNYVKKTDLQSIFRHVSLVSDSQGHTSSGEALERHYSKSGYLPT